MHYVVAVVMLLLIKAYRLLSRCVSASRVLT